MSGRGASFSSGKELILTLLGSLDDKERDEVIAALGGAGRTPCEKAGHKYGKPRLIAWKEHHWLWFQWGRWIYANHFTCERCGTSLTVALHGEPTGK